MSKYNDDRGFTNYIHDVIAIPKIYEDLGWKQIKLQDAFAKHIDMQKGIDYVFSHKGIIKTVQERFRDKKYEKFTDFTIRYRRDANRYADRRASEYYKMKASYFTYGITNCLKTDIPQCTDFLKYAVIDLEKVYAKLDSGAIVIKDNGRNTCRILDNKVIECPVKYNNDGSSSFFPIEISFLIQLFGNDIIVAQNGFM